MAKRITKALRKAPEELTLTEEDKKWIEQGRVDAFDVKVAENAKMTTTTVTFDVELGHDLNDLLLKYRRQAKTSLTRSKLLRVWMYALLNLPEAFEEELLLAEDENHMIQILLTQLHK